MTPPPVVAQRFEAAVPLDRLSLHPDNPNSGDLDLLGELLDANGFAGAVMAQTSTGIVFDGNHRLITARDKAMPALPVIWCDIDDDTRDRFLASFNESARRGHNDETKLVALLRTLEAAPRGLAGSGYGARDLADLVALLGPPDLDDLAGRLGEPRERDGWPSVSVRVPRHVAALWNEHLAGHGKDDAAAFAALLGAGLDPP